MINPGIKLYITHMSIHRCRSFLIENTKDALSEWYREELNIELPEEFWNDLCTFGPTGCTRIDEVNNVSVKYTMA